MTVMDPRPWSPAGPHIGPDDEDLALLEGTGDAEADLGSAVLVVHRVGGAAAEAVARAPLPDEYRLIEALATAREALAPRAVEAVGKCLGRQDAYADLLLRDLFDAGEQGALAVYRACVSKGVPPPLAVQRAGLVYGVPQGDLGRYLSVAADPRAHPVAIADAADRVIAKWASGVVRDEVAEPVSKRSVLEYNQTQTGHEHPKGQAGRFVTTLERPSSVAEAAVASRPAAGRVAGQPVGVLAGLRRHGIGAQVAPEVAGAPVTVEAPPPPPVRVTRPTRATRKTRKTRASEDTRLKGGLSAKLNSRLTGLLSSKTEARLNAQAARKTAFEDVDVAAPVAPTGETYGKIPNDIYLSWAMSSAGADDLWWNGQGPADRKVMVMGNLLNTLNEPYRWDTDQHTTMMARAAKQESQEALRTHKITGEELEAAGVDVYNGTPVEIARRVRDYAADRAYSSNLAVDPVRGTQDLDQLANQDVLPSADPKPGGLTDWYIIQKPKEGGGIYIEDDVETNPLPVAAEFVLDPERSDIRGNIVGGPNGTIELDPTQRVEARQKTRLWRDKGDGHYVERYTLFGLNDDVGKAVGVLERERTAWQTEARDDSGRWTSRGVLAPVMQRQDERLEVPVSAPPLPSTRPTRATRATRAVRATAPAGQVTGEIRGTLPAEMQAHLAAALQRRAEEAVEEPEPERHGFPMALDDRPRHVVMNMNRWGKFHQDFLRGRYVDDVTPIELDMEATHRLVGMKHLDGDQVDNRLRRNIVEHTARPEVREKVAFVTEMAPNDPRSWDELLDQVDSYMKGHQGAAYARVGASKVNVRQVTVYVNAEPVPDQVLIYMPEDFDPDRPITLRYMGKARRDELTQGRWRRHDPSVIVDAPVAAWRAEQRLYQARQSPRDE